jgi:hypothetical protein
MPNDKLGMFLIVESSSWLVYNSPWGSSLPLRW